MTKRTQRSASPSLRKQTGFLSVSPGKHTAIVENVPAVQERIIGWNFRLMDAGGPWPCTFRKLTRYRKRLLAYEGKTVAEAFNARHCHPVTADMLCPQAQTRLRALDIDGSIAQLDLGTPARLWGMLHHNVFHLLWLDLAHAVYPMRRS